MLSGLRPPPTPPPPDGRDPDALECLLRASSRIRRGLKERGIDVKRLSACPGKYRALDPEELDRLG